MAKQAVSENRVPDWQLEPIPSAGHTFLVGEEKPDLEPGRTPGWWIRLLLAPFLVVTAAAGLGLLGWFSAILTAVF